MMHILITSAGSHSLLLLMLHGIAGTSDKRSGFGSPSLERYSRFEEVRSGQGGVVCNGKEICCMNRYYMLLWGKEIRGQKTGRGLTRIFIIGKRRDRERKKKCVGFAVITAGYAFLLITFRYQHFVYLHEPPKASLVSCEVKIWNLLSCSPISQSWVSCNSIKFV